MSTRLPDSARVACWLNAWLAGRESTDAVISGLAGSGRLAEFAAPGTAPAAPALFLGEVRRRGGSRASVALPVPGDPLGLGGPAAFNTEALEAGEAVILHGAELGLIPVRIGAITRWQLGDAHPPAYLASVAEADLTLRRATSQAADALARLDVASWRPEVADLFLDPRQTRAPDPAPFAGAQAARLAHDALRAARIVTLAGRDDGAATSAVEADRRAAALQPLDLASRAGIVAAASSLDGR